MNRIVRDLPESDYHSLPALSAGGAWMLASECPALYHANSPFNPDALPPDNAKEMDIGTALHLAVLEPDRLADRTVLVHAENWRTKAAQEARDQAYDAGLTPLLPKDRDLVERLAAALRSNEFVAELIDGADTEVSYLWTSEGIPCKARADIISRDRRRIADLKASASAAPGFFQRQAFNAGHFLRAVWYQRGWQAVAGENADYWFVVVSRNAPHLVTIARLDDRALAWGEMMVRRALRLFRECNEAGTWPPYCTEPTTLALPTWAEFQLAEREQAGDFGAMQAATSLEWLRP